ncbi:SagB/ThcOx family dehydrogenase [Methanoculleus sp. FWC-SCC1]|uniref:SagB/ThcOx family dehydrogenase n=1 Tax=Methanoculleus frigidifontis TaxID=2584085 RepID=A0ABT8M9K3_9EURY|nr:SagB/ThcOx family dehydrogenase [Methanoculleus sp. FWC-SCC1]MDN7024621.1 SagB/ThcOx family dehydrogenase [Methanoculleus sp. FWC-SCC1]
MADRRSIEAARGAGRAFMEQTRYEHLSPSDQMRGLPPPPLEKPYTKGRRVVTLPSSFPSAGAVDLRTAIDRRESVRSYAPEPLALDEAAFLLWSTQGVKKAVRDFYTLRTVPSAGARHALETYLLANRVEGLAPGLYRYLALEHQLVEETTEIGIAGRIAEACGSQPQITASAVSFIWTAVAYRMTWRYGERGYRYLHLDAGHACQNLYLAAGAIGCGTCAIAAFHDGMLNELLGVDGEEEFALYVATVGKVP